MQQILYLIFFLCFPVILVAQTNGYDGINVSHHKGTNKWKTEITDPYIDSLNALAKASPIIGCDTESYWAAHAVDSLSKVYKQKPYDYYEQMAFCNYSQKLITYSLSYFIGIIGAQRDKELSDALLRIVPRAKETLANLHKADFKDYEANTKDFYEVVTNYSNYFRLYAKATSEDVFGGEYFKENMKIYETEVDYIYYLEPDKCQAYRMSSIIEQSVFFITYCKLYNALVSQKQYELNQGIVIRLATCFDSHTEPFQNTLIKSPQKISSNHMNDDEYFNFMKEATANKIEFIKLLTEVMESRREK